MVFVRESIFGEAALAKVMLRSTVCSGSVSAPCLHQRISHIYSNKHRDAQLVQPLRDTVLDLDCDVSSSFINGKTWSATTDEFEDLLCCLVS